MPFASTPSVVVCSRWCSIDYVVTVPDATTVTVENGSGDTTVSGALADLDVASGSGDIETAPVS